MSTEFDIAAIIHLLRDSDRPTSHDKLMQDAASALAQEHEYANLWRAFEELETVDDALIERTNQEIISDTEGNADLDGCVVSGDWERIFREFLYVVKKCILKWPEQPSRESVGS
jgi:trehalose utilization protein